MKVKGRAPLTTRYGSAQAIGSRMEGTAPSHFIRVHWNAFPQKEINRLLAVLHRIVQFDEKTKHGSVVAVFGFYSEKDASNFSQAVQLFTHDEAVTESVVKK